MRKIGGLSCWASPVNGNDVPRSYELTDHADAAKSALLRIIKQLNGGTSPEDLGEQVVLIGRMMARRT